MTTSSFPSGSQRFPHLHDFHGAQNIQGISPETPPKRQRQWCLGSQCFFLRFLTTTTATQREIQVETRTKQHAAMQSGGACWQVFGSSCQKFWNGLVSENDQSIWSSRFLDFQFMPMYLSETKQWCVEIHPLEMFWSTLHHGTWTKVLRPMLSMFFNPSEHISYSTNKQLE